ncbi:hypothetical protein [Streptomyces coffeae]|uniref:Nucleotide exchange factor GrpE n=1 Tax=Streptomyces coffeae TaxID=621382 RepID=A0ABS1N5H5_9ACTN|nr:hypothetical protein [Streptomyces coffeae]MBL1095169.1 hypothetical protein [Streptomyces coffeae]
MPSETANTPAATDSSDQGELSSIDSARAATTTPGTTPDPVEERQLAVAEQRATEQSERAEQLQAALDAVHQALNPDGGEGGQDLAQLAAQVADRDKQLADVGAQLRTAQVELAAHRAAAEQGERADRLLNSRSFLDSVAALDPTGPKFEQQLSAAITAAVGARLARHHPGT